MKTLTYKDLDAFKKRIQHAPAWEDFFMLGGRMYNIYEYGDARGEHGGRNYCYWINRRTHDAIKVEYDCPSTDWKKTGRIVKKGDQIDDGRHSYSEDGAERVKVQTMSYTLYHVEFIPNLELWREII